MIVQIYSFTDPWQAREAARMGVDHVGFIAGTNVSVPGMQSFEKARAIVEALPHGATSVALTMDTEVDEILRMVEAVRPDIVHISTDMDDVDLPKMKDLRARLPKNVRVMKAISVTDESTVTAAVYYAQASDLLLLDTKSTNVAGIGVSGKTHDWGVSRKIIESVSIPVILAGGLSAENVAEAMRATRPWGVDSNTHTNIPGDMVQKDMQRIRAFVKTVREAETFRNME